MQRWIGGLPPLPWRICLVALLTRVLLGGALPVWVPTALRPWLSSLDELVISYAALLLVAWLVYDLPASLKLWRSPPKILRDLTLLLIASALTVVIVQQQVRINLVSLVTASAVLTAVIGLAAQETLKDLFAGMTLQLDPPFRQGDWIAIGDAEGIVTSLSLMNTELTIFDGSVVVFPNSIVAEGKLKRHRPDDPLRVHFKIGLDYSFPPAQACRLLHEALQRNRLVLAEPAPRVWVDSYADSAIVYEVLAFSESCPRFPFRDLRSALLIQIWYALKRVGQSIPFPVRQLQPHRRPGQAAEALVNAAIAERFAALSRNVLFSGLDEHQREQLALLTRVEDYAPGEAVVVEDDDDDDLFQVLSGRLDVWRDQSSSSEPGQQWLAELKADDIFGEMSLLLDAPRSATVRAVDAVRLLRVKRDDIAPLLAQDPHLLEQLALIVDQRRRSSQALDGEKTADPSHDILATMKSLFDSLLRRV